MGGEDTANALWRRGRPKEANVDPRGVGTLQVDIQVGDPLSSVFHQQKREQEEALLAQKPRRLRDPSGVASRRRSCSSALDSAYLIEERSRRRRCKHRPRAPAAMRHSAIGTARSGMIMESPQGGAHAIAYMIEGVCADEADEGMNESSSTARSY